MNEQTPKRNEVALLRRSLSRKEVFQPHLPVRLPCYDLAPVNSFTLGRSLRVQTSGTTIFHGLTGGVYKARERIHRAMADARLLAIPASRGRVAAPDPDCDRLSGSAPHIIDGTFFLVGMTIVDIALETNIISLLAISQRMILG